jgi:cold shock CspA family protein
LLQGLEVSFFVIHESIKGSMSERAVHLQVLPRGSVQFEQTLAEAAVGIVVKEPLKTSNHESPGFIRMLTPIAKQSSSSSSSNNGITLLQEVELWARCMPDSLSLRVGDAVVVDVTHYRPENLIFARSLRVKSYRALGRETGLVKSVRGQGYGFISSTIRDFDLYFRTNEVVGANGEVLRDRDIDEGMMLSYDVVVEDAQGSGGLRSQSPVINMPSSGNVKLRAVRLMLITDPANLLTTNLIRQGIEGVVHRDAKKDNIGIIRVSSNVDDVNMVTAGCPLEILNALAEFEATPDLREITIDLLPVSQRKCYYRALDTKYPHLCHESIDNNLSKDGSKLLSLRIWKPKSSEDYEIWSSQRMNSKSESAAAAAEATKKITTVHFMKTDVASDFLTKDMEVVFDLHLDCKSGNFVAKNVVLTDKPCSAHPSMVPLQGTDRYQGVIQVINAKGQTKFGFIRCVPTSQKLFWHDTYLASSDVCYEGQEVSFRMRLRGGLPCAVNVQALPVGSLSGEFMVPGDCVGVVVDDRKIVLLDVSQCPMLSSHFSDGGYGSNAASSSSSSTSAASAADGVWKRENIDDVAPLSAAVGEADGANEGEENAAGAGVSAAIDGPGEAADRKAPRYFDLLPRVPLDIKSTNIEQTAVIERLQPGEVVKCQCVVNWAQSAAPQFVCHIRKVSVDTQESNVLCVRKSRGSIVRMKIKSKATATDKSTSNPVELCEVKETSRGPTLWASSAQAESAGVAGSTNAFFCDLKEINKPMPSMNTRNLPVNAGLVQLNDAVDYYGIQMSNGITFAVGVNVVTASVPTALEMSGVS